MISFPCNLSYTLTSIWLSPQISNLASISTSSLAQLVIPSNTLSYGIYEFTYQVIATITSTNVVLAANIQSTFVQIVPTGLAVFAIPNGVSGIMIGSLQSYVLSPGLYSIDFDNIIAPGTLIYKFYCQTMVLNIPNSVLTSNEYDLLSYKNNASLPMTSNQTCFSSNSNIILTNNLKKW